MRRQDITFEDKDQALRNDVRTLGMMVGQLIAEQGGDELFEFDGPGGRAMFPEQPPKHPTPAGGGTV